MSGASMGFLASEVGAPGEGGSLFHVMPVPFERSVSYGAGTSRGPEAILEASQQLELLDDGIVPAGAGIYTRSPLECSGQTSHVLENLSAVVADARRRGKIPVVLGGEHTVTLGAVRGTKQAAGNSLGVVQIDAHADLRDTYQGDRYSHACVMRRIVEEGIPVLQIGVRSMSEEERDYRAMQGIAAVDADRFGGPSLPQPLIPESFPEHVYLTIDVDGFDPSVIPATGTPEPGGLSWRQGVEVLAAVAGARRIVGFDVVELSPVPGLHYAEYAAARLIYRIMGCIVRTMGNAG